LSCLIRAFAEVHSEIPGLRLALVGTGPRGSNYRSLVRELNLDGSVRFSGAVRNDLKLLEYYASSDIVVLPSNVGGPISCTILEGLSCGKAVISTAVPGGIPDVLGGGVGILMRPEDQAELASELKRLVTDHAYLEAYQTNARRAVEERYTLDSMGRTLIDLYRELAA
jgi:glycosyltransferase involved in cell wall biosynthesis